MFVKYTDDTKLIADASTLKNRAIIQNYLQKEKNYKVNRMQFNMGQEQNITFKLI